jgi:hypothetical protein
MLPDEKVVNVIEVAGAALERHAQFYQEKQAEANQVAAAIPDVVQILVQHGRIEPGEAKEAAEALKDHRKTLQLLKLAAVHMTAEEEARLGQPLPPGGQHKSASSNGNGASGGYIGRRTAEPPESWRNFERALGL